MYHRRCNGIRHHYKTILRADLNRSAQGNTTQTETPPPIMQWLFSWYVLPAFFASQKACFPDCRPRAIPSKCNDFDSSAAAQPAVKSGTRQSRYLHVFVVQKGRLIVPASAYYERPDHLPEAGAACFILTQTDTRQPVMAHKRHPDPVTRLDGPDFRGLFS